MRDKSNSLGMLENLDEPMDTEDTMLADFSGQTHLAAERSQQCNLSLAHLLTGGKRQGN